MSNAVTVKDLRVLARGRDGTVPLVDGIDLRVHRKEIVGIVGETGAGKTLAMKALLGVLPRGVAAAGTVQFGDDDPVDVASRKGVREYLGRKTGLVLQNPAGMLDPLIRVKHQLVEGVLRLGLMRRRAALERAEQLLGEMGFDDPRAVLQLYPHQLSGGMAQRVAIAMAMMPRPLVLVVDEPTSALDAHIRVEVLTLLRSVAQTEQSSVVLVSHDLGLVSHFCDHITVMYAGHVMESGPTELVLADPQHPYTAALLRCSPSLAAEPRSPLPAIEGTPPRPGAWPEACVFEPRCPLAFDRCREERPMLRRVRAHYAACHLAFEKKERAA